MGCQINSVMYAPGVLGRPNTGAFGIWVAYSSHARNFDIFFNIKFKVSGYLYGFLK